MGQPAVTIVFLFATIATRFVMSAGSSSRSLLASGVRSQTLLQATAGGVTADTFFGTETAVDNSNPEYMGFLEETKKGATDHKRYEDIVRQVAAERDVDIDIHSQFGELEEEDVEAEEELRQDPHFATM